MEVLLLIFDKLADLLRERREGRAILYREFVAPSIEALDSVHENYLNSFRKYREDVPNSKLTLPLIVDAVYEDALYSAGLRARLSALKAYREHDALGPFVSSVLAYLDKHDGTYFCHSNSYRAGLLCCAIDALNMRRPLMDEPEYAELGELAKISRWLGEEPGSGSSIESDIRRLSPLRAFMLSTVGYKLGGADWRPPLIRCIDKSVAKLQQRYSVVLDKHSDLKWKLLART